MLAERGLCPPPQITSTVSSAAAEAETGSGPDEVAAEQEQQMDQQDIDSDSVSDTEGLANESQQAAPESPAQEPSESLVEVEEEAWVQPQQAAAETTDAVVPTSPEPVEKSYEL